MKELQQKNDTLQSQLDSSTQSSKSDTSNGSASSRQDKTVTVPDVTGKSAASARTSLESLGLVVTSSGATSSSSTVVSTTPEAGTKVSPGSTVKLICSDD